MWGCFCRRLPTMYVSLVFPTHVGVFLTEAFLSAAASSLPHACGGVSPITASLPRHTVSSPRMWGCFRYAITPSIRTKVFPTHVGVFLDYGHIKKRDSGLPHACGGVSSPVPCATCAGCLPHACGGVSGSRDIRMETCVSSPRMWGCFWGSLSSTGACPVFPTHVGVFLLKGIRDALFPSLPHACGGVSVGHDARSRGNRSSPRMWGCFRT